jgi:hypothetical protein
MKRRVCTVLCASPSQFQIGLYTAEYLQIFVLFTKYYWNHEIKGDEVGGKSSAHGRYEKKFIQNIGRKP